MPTAISQTKSRSVHLTLADKQKLEQLCRDRTNWTDGGYWMGVGKEPNCFVNEKHVSTLKIIFSFPSDTSAFAWNKKCEDVLRYKGYVSSAALSVLIGIATDGVYGIVAGIISSIFKSEAEARVKYPQMARGWKFILTIKRTYHWTPHPLEQRTFTLDTTGEGYDEHGQLKYKSRSIDKYNFDKISEKVAKIVSTIPSKTINIVYKGK